MWDVYMQSYTKINNSPIGENFRNLVTLKRTRQSWEINKNMFFVHMCIKTVWLDLEQWRKVKEDVSVFRNTKVCKTVYTYIKINFLTHGLKMW
jgi:hypothetical protein